MLSLSEHDRINVEAILESIQKIETFTKSIKNAEEFYKDEKAFDAILMNFVIIGEPASKISLNFKTLQPDIPWNKIKAFRNFVTHNYFGVDAEEVWQVIHSHLPPLKEKILSILYSYKLCN